MSRKYTTTGAATTRRALATGLLALVLAHWAPTTASAQTGTWRAYMAYHDVQQICAAGDDLFVLASDNLYQYNRTDQSIVTYDKLNGLSDSHITLIAWNPTAKRLIAVYQNSNIDLLDTKGNVTNISALYAKATMGDKTVDSLTIDGPYAYLYARLGIVKVNMQRAEISDTYTPSHPDYPTSLPPYDDSDYDRYLPLVQTLQPGGPKYNYFYESKLLSGKLYTTGGYFLSGVADLDRPGTVQTWDGERWQTYQEQLDTITGYAYKDINCLDVDPTDSAHVFSGGRCGLYEFRSGRLVAYYNQQNSPLHGAVSRGVELGNDYTVVNGLKFDADGNLYVTVNRAKSTSLLRLSADKQWTDLHSPLLADNDDISHAGLRTLFTDSRGLLWFVNSDWRDASVFCYDAEADELKRYSKYVNQDGTSYEVTSANCVCEDREGNIWVGTDKGPFYIDRSEVGQASVTFQQVKVPRNDGSNLADYLLTGVTISSIAIDGGGRKWFCSNGAGAFLISADNLEQLQYFTTDNSALLSNNVMSASVNQQTGEVFFLTENGLCSYFSDASAPATDMDKDHVYAYPNPVSPDYTGLITVVGLSYNADVKILTSNGRLVAEGRSNGGTFTWNGCDRQGRRVASGVYMVASATEEGKKGTVCKIAIIR